MSETSQAAGTFPYCGTADRRVVALTFDDGPNDPYTGALAELLADRQVPATFFQVGRCVERHPQRSKELAAAGHLIGNHSYRHRFDDYLRPDKFLADVDRTQQIIADVTGTLPRHFRPPWLYRTPALLAGIADRDLRVVSGRFCDPLEVLQPSSRRIARQAERRVEPGSMIIFHDGFDDRGGFRGRTVAAVGLLIDRLREVGYGFVTVDELLPVPCPGGSSARRPLDRA
ncbi:polysaccharide deacetylase family protein [Microlunatus elymi]|uniref:Polysaccharide deacetylase family protein n=2 Tax=Microlunatus elymi TaxID=2596828 RepID=A0A516Q6D7_9ACTN|nr:polysaccharide deacetylase family protein [Microlunatus elymi]